MIRLVVAGLAALGGARVLELLGGDAESSWAPSPVVTISAAMVVSVVAWRMLK